MDDVLGKLRGAYDKKWWTFPSFLDNGFGPAVEKLYKDYLPLTFKAQMTTYPQLSSYVPEALKRTVKANWDRLEQDILAEANALWQPCIDCLRNDERPPEYTLLAPLNHWASVSPQVAKDYVLRLKKLAVNDWVPELPPRPALGYVGLNELLDERVADFDESISRLVTNQVVDQTDQSTWLFSHSGMRIPSHEVFKRSFMDEIIEPILKEGVGFGSY